MHSNNMSTCAIKVSYHSVADGTLDSTKSCNVLVSSYTDILHAVCHAPA